MDYTNCRIVCNKVNIAFFRVLYKDWLSGRWDGAENELARIALSASEPYTLLVTPSCWHKNKGTLIDNVDRFVELNRERQLPEIHKILEMGVSEEYMVINSRLLLQKRDDFEEELHFNITLHHNGIESFKQSNIMCGFSKKALLTFGWYISVDSDGAKLFDEQEDQIGQLECYNGNRNSLENRYHSNQPHLQRWIVQKGKFEKLVKQSKIPVGIKCVTDISVSDFE